MNEEEALIGVSETDFRTLLVPDEIIWSDRAFLRGNTKGDSTTAANTSPSSGMIYVRRSFWNLSILELLTEYRRQLSALESKDKKERDSARMAQEKNQVKSSLRIGLKDPSPFPPVTKSDNHTNIDNNTHQQRRIQGVNITLEEITQGSSSNTTQLTPSWLR